MFTKNVRLLTVGVSDAGSAGFGGGSAQHEPGKVDQRLLLVLPAVLLLSQRLLQELVDDEVDDGFRDPPPGGRHTLPETSDTLNTNRLVSSRYSRDLSIKLKRQKKL